MQVMMIKPSVNPALSANIQSIYNSEDYSMVAVWQQKGIVFEYFDMEKCRVSLSESLTWDNGVLILTD